MFRRKMTNFCLVHSIFSFFRLPCENLSTFDDRGNQRRHQREACEAAILKGIEVYTRDLVGLLQRRIESRSSHEPLLLPPTNFHLDDRRLDRPFCELTRGIRAWANAMPETVRPQMFDHEMLPDFLGRNERQLIFRDSRNVVFPCARPTEFHGALRSIPVRNWISPRTSPCDLSLRYFLAARVPP